MGTPVTVLEVTNSKELSLFVKLPLTLYAGDPLYSPQLTKDLKKHFCPYDNPFFEFSTVKFYLAYRGTPNSEKNCVGRVVSIINKRHLEYHNDGAGFFGFFESVNDEQVSSALLDAVRGDLKPAGLRVMRGPMSFSTNEECGFLLDGFNLPPMIMTPYNPPYYNDLIRSYGMEKVKDLYAYIVDVPDVMPEKVYRAAAIAEKKGITARLISMDKLTDDLMLFKDLYNAAWKDNWGFIPITDGEIEYTGQQMKQIIYPETVVIAMCGTETVGFLGLIPDANFVLRHMGGKFNPITMAKAVYLSKKIRDARLMLLGTKAEYRNRGVDGLLFREAFKGCKKHRIERVEFSWILEDNVPVQMLIKMIGGVRYKTFRIYERAV
ncbi:MAG: N-acetyltransferase [Nitrospirae bacterium]|nr:N-acetyltransferase [Nitrospirota bacterium]